MAFFFYGDFGLSRVDGFCYATNGVLGYGCYYLKATRKETLYYLNIKTIMGDWRYSMPEAQHHRKLGMLCSMQEDEESVDDPSFPRHREHDNPNGFKAFSVSL